MTATPLRLLTRCAWIAVGCLGLATQAQAPVGEAGPRVRAQSTAAATTVASSTARVIVRYKADSATDARSVQIQSASTTTPGPARASALSSRHGLALSDGRALDARTQVLHASGLTSAELAARLAADPEVEFAQVDRPMRAFAAPNDPLYASGQTGSNPVVGQWYLRAPTVSTPAAINAEGAWDVTAGSASIVVAVLDTGVRTDHPDLVGKLLPGYDFISDAGTANDSDGRDADPSDPGDGVTSADVTNGVGGCTSADIGNSSWHGTQTAGIVGATTNNSTGIASVGPNLKVLPVRVLGKCGGYESDVIAGMQWAAGIPVPGIPNNPTPAKVLNLSLGGTGSCDTAYQNAVSTLIANGVTIVAAAGNGVTGGGVLVDVPANCTGVIGVAGVRQVGSKVGYSNLGTQIAIAAPAGNCINTTGACLYPIVTTTNAGTQAPTTNTYTGSGSNASIGTSFAAPQVAAAAGLVLSANATLTPAQVRAVLQGSARAFPITGGTAGISQCTTPSASSPQGECYCTTSTCGAGMLDVAAAVTAAAAGPVAMITGSTSVTAGSDVTLDGASSTTVSGRTITSYAWSIVSGASAATIKSAANASTVTLATTAAGSVTVQLVVTDSTAKTASTTTVITVAAAGGSSGGGSSSSGGGGAVDLTWLLLAVAGTVGAGSLVAQRRRSRRP